MTALNGAAHQATPLQDLPPPGAETSTDTSNVTDIGLAAPPPDPSPTTRTDNSTRTDSNVIDIGPATPNLPAPSESNVVPLPRHRRPRRLDVSKFPDPPLKPKGAPVTTIANVAHLLTSYDIKVRYNVIRKKLIVVRPDHTGSPDNFDSVALAHIQSLANLNGMQTGLIPGFVEAVGDMNLFNPVADWISSKPWDRKDRLPTLYATLVEREGFPPDLKVIVVRRWLLSAVAAALMPSRFRCRGVLVLQGAQGIGKTAWTKALVNDPALSDEVIKLDHHLDASNKDTLLSAIRHWLVEIGELDGSLKKDIARLKGFITADRDKIRVPYGRTESEYARKTVFCATVNDPNFLVDPTGNARWWTLPVVSINYEHGIDMQQVFAQLAVDFANGEQWWLTHAEQALLDEQNRGHRTESVIREGILGEVDLERKVEPGLPPMTATEMLKRAGIERPTNPQLKECCGVLRELFGDSKKIRGQHKWRIPLRESAFGLDQMVDDSPEAGPDPDTGLAPGMTF